MSVNQSMNLCSAEAQCF